MKVSHKLAILIKKSLSAKAIWCMYCPTRVWNLEASTVWIRKTATIVRLPRSGRPRSAHSSGGPCAQSRRQTKKAPINLLNFAWNCHSPFKCA